jgi:hypothetical protein
MLCLEQGRASFLFGLCVSVALWGRADVLFKALGKIKAIRKAAFVGDRERLGMSVGGVSDRRALRFDRLVFLIICIDTLRLNVLK